MKAISFLIKPASSMCMLHCRYCFYHDVSDHRSEKNHGLMKAETCLALIQKACKIVSEEGSITFAFQGGEPTLAGIAYFENFCERVLQYKKPRQQIQYAIQTNGYLIDDAWCELFHKYNFLVGVSLDGYRENHDYFRLNDRKKATFHRVMKSIQTLRKYKVDFNILSVLSKQLAKHPQKLYDFYKKEGFSHIQLIPCLAGLEEREDPFALSPQLFASFYKIFYDLWLKDFQKGQAMSIYLFDNLIPMFANLPPQQCGLLGFCSLQFVVESDGSVYPCDFYVLDEYCGGNIMHASLQEIAESKQMIEFLQVKQEKSSLCTSCQLVSMCNGNCKRMRSLYQSDGYCGYHDFLMYAAPSMSAIAQQILRNR